MGSGVLKYVRENKKLLLIAGIAVFGLFLVIVSSSFGGEKASENSNVETLEEYKTRLEGEIESLCSDVSGVGKCRVFITFERGAQNSYKGSTVTETKPPRVLGVTVICRGGDSDSVKRELSDMICAIFDIGYNRVAILKLNS